MREYAWKVLDTKWLTPDREPKRTSAFARGEAQVTYIPGKWIKAPRWLARKGYHLVVFDKFEQARDFALELRKDAWYLEIWLVEAVDEVPLPAFCNVWELALRRIKRIYLPWYPGTRMFKKIRLIKRYDIDGKEVI